MKEIKKTMGQGDIIKLLKKEKKYLSTKEIANKLGVGFSTTIMCLRKMRDRGEIELKKEGRNYLYKIK